MRKSSVRVSRRKNYRFSLEESCQDIAMSYKAVPIDGAYYCLLAWQVLELKAIQNLFNTRSGMPQATRVQNLASEGTQVPVHVYLLYIQS